MPEVQFEFTWPDGTKETAYSPSLVVKQYFEVGQIYPLKDFLERSRTALQIASDRVEKKYGYPCSIALRQLKQIETTGTQFSQHQDPKVQILRFIEYELDPKNWTSS
ncbi:MAG: MSMEG_0570 family nitrogen starvation response protein [Anaerolineae bacterium]|nr:MSMEG_0570 family nitrogen starvation response protein [Gloeobacterales cyanobacterium ES-bin-313]